MAESHDPLPEPDRLDGAPHPRETLALWGQEDAERELLSAYVAGRMHHAWILGGPAGIGKATLAYRLARFLFAHPDPEAPEVRAATSLAVAGDHPAARQVAGMAHPDLLVLRRGWVAERKTVSTEIRVADVRRVGPFFGSTAGQGGWRICIVDSAEDLNLNGANALLKTLEEPPPRSLFLLVSSSPQRLLPTIRSRCRTLMLAPLTAEAMEAAVRDLEAVMPELDPEAVRAAAGTAEGSLRRALERAGGEGEATREATGRLLDSWPAFDRGAVHTLAEAAAKGGAEATATVVEQVLDWMHAQGRRQALSPSGAPSPWPDLWNRTAQAARDCDTFNLDRKAMILNIFSELARG